MATVPTSHRNIYSHHALHGYAVAIGLATALAFLLSCPPAYYVRVLPPIQSISQAIPVEDILRMFSSERLPGSNTGGEHGGGEPSSQPPRPVFTVAVPPVDPGDIAPKQPVDDPVQWGDPSSSDPGNGHGGPPDGIGTRGDGGTDTGTKTTVVQDADEALLFAVDSPPQYSLNDLRANVHFPDIARQNGIEGMVVVKVMIGATGAIESLEVVSSDNSVFEEAAMMGLRRTAFTPAMQNGVAVRCMVVVPVRFSLR